MMASLIPHPCPVAGRARLAGAALGLLMTALTAGAAGAAEASYPFEGTWILPQHACVPGSMHLRTYTARDVVSARGKCTIRRVAQGTGAFELLEECRREGRTSKETETIRMTSPDTLLLRRQLTRLKIPRQLHYARCNPSAAPAPMAPHASGRTVASPAPEPQRHTP